MRIKYTFSLELKCSIMSEKPYNHNVSIGLWIKTTHMDVHQGVWNRREIQLTRPARWLYMPCRRYSFCIRNIQIRIGYCIRGNCTSDKYFLFKWRTVGKAYIIIWLGVPRQLYLPYSSYSLTYMEDFAVLFWKKITLLITIISKWMWCLMKSMIKMKSARENYESSQEP